MDGLNHLDGLAADGGLRAVDHEGEFQTEADHKSQPVPARRRASRARATTGRNRPRRDIRFASCCRRPRIEPRPGEGRPAWPEAPGVPPIDSKLTSLSIGAGDLDRAQKAQSVACQPLGQLGRQLLGMARHLRCAGNRPGGVLGAERQRRVVGNGLALSRGPQHHLQRRTTRPGTRRWRFRSRPPTASFGCIEDLTL